MRDLSSDMLSALTADVVRPRFFFEGVFASTTLRYSTHSEDLSWDSKTWLGNGFLADPGVYTDSTSNSVEVKLIGQPSALVSLALQDVRQGQLGRIWLVLLNSSNAIIADPFLQYVGKLDKCDTRDSPAGSQIVLTYSSRLINLERSREFRFNHETQQAFFPGDLGFQYVEQIAKDYTQYWGKQQK